MKIKKNDSNMGCEMCREGKCKDFSPTGCDMGWQDCSEDLPEYFVGSGWLR